MAHLASGSETSQTLATDGQDGRPPCASERGWELLIRVKYSTIWESNSLTPWILQPQGRNSRAPKSKVSTVDDAVYDTQDCLTLQYMSVFNPGLRTKWHHLVYSIYTC